IALRIKGNSMVGAGIFDGDLVIVKIGVEVKDNDIVVAFVDNEVTCKRLKVTEDKIQLVPENPDYKIIEMKREEARLYILGKVVGLFRRIG
ncbi:MAG: S24 family peptidase, partial [candidate division WOR-3 bacterium]